MIPIPAPPTGLLKQTREAWDEFWCSDLARLIDRRNEGRGIIYRYFALFDEWARARTAYKRQRLVKGSTGQTVVNPAFKAWMQIGSELLKLEKETGLTTKGRLLFGLQAGRIRDEIEELNEGFEDEDDEEAYELPPNIRVVNKVQQKEGERA
jgi:phage terminase small subunit